MDMALRKNTDPYNIYNWLDPSMGIITIVIAFLNHARNRDEDFFKNIHTSELITIFNNIVRMRGERTKQLRHHRGQNILNNFFF